MSSNMDNSEYKTADDRDSESSPFLQERITTSEQWINLLSYIVRTIGIAFALFFNFIVFVPCFFFAILPIILFKHFDWSPTPKDLNPASTSLASVPVHPKSIHLTKAYVGSQLPSADISPLLLSADFEIDKNQGLGTDLRAPSVSLHDLPRLPTPAYEAANSLPEAFRRKAPSFQQTRPRLICKDCGGKVVENCPGSKATGENTLGVETPQMKEPIAVDSLAGTPTYSRGLTSGLMVSGGGASGEESTLLQRNRTSKGLQCSTFSHPEQL